MSRSRTPLALAALAVALTGCTAGPSSDAAIEVRIAPAITTSPQPLPPPAAQRLAAPVPDGTVLRKAGPFDDRFSLTGTRLSRGTVDTALLVTSDVSEVIVLEAVADFYDAQGSLLGSTRETHAPDHAHGETAAPDESVHLELAAEPAYRSRVASAVLSVPVLVNE